MSFIKINNEKATDRAALVKLCPFGAIEDKDGRLEINAGCRMCRMCIKKGGGVFEFVEDGAASAADAVASGSGAAMPKGFGKPKITDFRVVDGNVYITVKGSHGSMRYGVRSGKRIDALVGDGESRYGKTGGELIIVKPQNGESGFYAVEEVKE